MDTNNRGRRKSRRGGSASLSLTPVATLMAEMLETRQYYTKMGKNTENNIENSLKIRKKYSKCPENQEK
jgi:hypothetical protein